MKHKTRYKFVIIVGEVFLIGLLALVFWRLLPSSSKISNEVQIDEVFGQVQRYSPGLGRFVDAADQDSPQQEQQLLTKGESWASLSFFNDGIRMHVDPFSSLSLLGTGEENGVQFARLHLDIGRVTVMSFGSVVYIEAPGGIVFADVPGTVVNVWVDAENKQTSVFCLEGVCKINNRRGSVMLSEGQEALLSDQTSVPVIMGLYDGSRTKGLVQDLETTKNTLLEAALQRDLSAENVNSETAGYMPVDCGPPADWVIYTVLPGDSYDALLKEFSVNGKEFQKANCLGESEVNVAGLNLFVPILPETPVELAVAPSTQAVQPTVQATQTPKPNPTEQVHPTGDPEGFEIRDIPILHFGDYISNPGMGWQYRGGTFPITIPAETVAYSRRSQISWNVLNPAEGIYDWSALDAQLQTAVSQGKQSGYIP